MNVKVTKDVIIKSGKLSLTHTNIFRITDTQTDYSNPCYAPTHSEINNKWIVHSNNFNIYEYFSHVLQTDSFIDLITCKSKNIMYKIISLIQSNNDIDVLTTIKEYIQSSISVLELKHTYYLNKEI